MREDGQKGFLGQILGVTVCAEQPVREKPFEGPSQGVQKLPGRVCVAGLGLNHQAPDPRFITKHGVPP